MKPVLTYPEWKAAEERRRKNRRDLYAAWLFVFVVAAFFTAGVVGAAAKVWRSL